MKSTAFSKLMIALIAMCSWLTVNGQQYPDSLVQYLEIAAKNNPAVRQKFTEYQAALQKVPQVESLSDPELSLGVFLKPMELVSGNQVADIKLMQMFPWFGVLRNAKDEMGYMANAKFEIFRDAKLQVYYDVQSAYYELYKVGEEISISEKNVEILKVIERLALAGFKSAASGNFVPASSGPGMSSGPGKNVSMGSVGMQGMGAGQGNSGSSASNMPSESMQTASMGPSPGGPGLADLYRIQIEAGDLENNIALLKSRRQSIIARFNSYLNRQPLTPVFTGDSLGPVPLILSLTAVPDSILKKNPMLTMLEFERQSFEARKRMVTGMGYPMIGLGLSYSVISRNMMSASEMNGNDMLMPMLTVTLPVYRKKYTAMNTEADLLGTAASLNYEATANALLTEYYQAVQLYQDAQRRMQLYESQFQLASKSLDLMLKSFTASSSGLTDVLRVQQQTLDYELKKTEAVADFNTAAAWINRLMAFSQLQ